MRTKLYSGRDRHYGVISRANFSRINDLQLFAMLDSSGHHAILDIEIAPRWTSREAPAGLFVSGGVPCP
jgi:hypothetical protein